MHAHAEQGLPVKPVLVFLEDLLLAPVILNVPVKEEHQPHLVLVMLFVTVIYKILLIIDYSELPTTLKTWWFSAKFHYKTIKNSL
jgi:hypothetical protein